MSQYPVFRRVVWAVGLLLATTGIVQAQTVRGSVRSVETSLPIASVQIVLRDSAGVVIGSTVSDDQGLFLVRAMVSRPFSVQARRLGFQLADTDMLRFSPADTLEMEFRLAQVALSADAVEVTGMMPLNEERLQEAHRKGWRVYEPELIAEHRDRARDLQQLLRSVGTQSLVMPRGPSDCIRNARTNRCITYVVDNQVLGTENLFILPADIYFVAILSPAESRVQYGNRANDGAIAIFTRQRGDRTDRPAAPGATNANRRTPAPSRPPQAEPGAAATPSRRP